MSDNFFLQHDKAVTRYIMQHEAQAAIANPIPIMYRAHDPLLHTPDHPFCSDPFCPCHDVVTDENANEAYWRLICEPMKNGLMTADEANRIFFNEQV